MKCNIVVIRNKVAVVRFRVCLAVQKTFSFALFFKYSHIDDSVIKTIPVHTNPQKLKMHLHYAS